MRQDTEEQQIEATKTYSLLSSSISNFFCVPFGGYAMLSCSQTDASARSVSPVAFIIDAGLRCFGFIELESKLDVLEIHAALSIAQA